MKRAIFTILSFLIIQFCFGEEIIKTLNDSGEGSNIELISSDIESTVLNISLFNYSQEIVESENGAMLLMDCQDGSRILKAAAPDLPKLSTSIIIPEMAEMDVEIIKSSYKEFTDIEIIPSKGNLSRSIDPSSVPYTFGEEYSKDEYFPGELATLGKPYIIRDYRGQAVSIFPFQYNPLKKTLRVYTNITLKIHKTSSNGANPLIRTRAFESLSRDFVEVYKKHFINYPQSRYTPLEENGNMLIIAYPDFMDAMIPFINWKNKSGRPVEIVDVTTIGNSGAIKDYVANYYNTYGLTYLLLVGDAPQVPTSYNNGDSDNDYAYVVGNDHYADFFVGRFSAESAEQVTTQVNRTLTYEKNPQMAPLWCDRNMGISSSQGPGDDNEYDYEHIRNMQSDLLGYTYTYAAELFDGNQGGNDAAGNPTPAMVANEINTGISNIVYCGHGSTTSWSSSGFSNSDVNNLSNAGMWPFIWSVACVNGNFKNNTCFAEAWLRATDNTGQPTGAIGTLMSTINQSWDPPMEGQDEMVDILVESYTDNIKRTFAGVSINGCFQMLDTYGTSGEDVADTWTVFGDPSVMVRTSTPLSMEVDYQDPIPIGSTELEVSANVMEGTVAITKNNQILGTAQLSGGTATVSFPEVTEICFLDIVITSYNCIPFIGEVEVVGQPGQANMPSPPNGSSTVDPFTSFSWGQGDAGIPEYYKLYLGTDNPPSNIFDGKIVNENYYVTEEDLDFETQYFWRVDSYNQHGSATGEVWSFTTTRAPDENFETADFTANAWSFAGNSQWMIDQSETFNGAFAAKSGMINDNESSSLILTLDVAVGFNTAISFYKKVSSAPNDKLEFIIDGEIVDSWSGLSLYSKESYMVTDGIHTFEWKYIKDESSTMGEDAAWIDYIYFPPLADPTIYAGDDASICEGLSFTPDSYAYNYISAEWQTNGDGSFDDIHSLQATYTPGPQDYVNGLATLILNVNSYAGPMSDDMTLSFDYAPESPQAPQGPDYVDLYYNSSSVYTTEGTANATDYSWTIDPEEAGNLDSDAMTCTVSWNPDFLGMANIFVKGINNCGEGEFSEPISVTINNTVGIIGNGKNFIDIIPNPSDGNIKLNISIMESGRISLEVFSIEGNSVFSKEYSDASALNSEIFNFNNLPSGMYLMRITSNNTSAFKKMIINK